MQQQHFDEDDEKNLMSELNEALDDSGEEETGRLV